MGFHNKDISEEDKASLILLNTQLNAININIISSIVLYIATLQGIKVITDKYDDSDIDIPKITPDKTVILSSYIGLYSSLITNGVAVTSYNNLCEKKKSGDFKYSLEPDQDIITASYLYTLSNLFYLKAGYGILERDGDQPIVGF